MSSPVLPQEIIRAKRDGGRLADDAIAAMIEGLVSGAVSEGQAAAFAMAVFFQGMDLSECVALTRAMTRSGRVLEWDLPGPVLDKHSTGGVGDTVSLMLAPAVAACGGYVPMISGRGLGHTGGTLDKLEAIPGYRAQPDEALLARVTTQVGCAVIGQTADLAPADRRLYAIRDVTATVESIPLITASILSKKLAAGLQGLVLDVKAGNGAFMETLAGARELAASLAQVANGAGLPTCALITAMDQPLAPAAGNAVETRLAVDFLRGGHEGSRLWTVTVELGAEMLRLGGLAPGLAEGRERIAGALRSGAAAERFARMVAALGGPADLLERPDAHLAPAPLVRPVLAEGQGVVTAIDTRALGLAVVALGGGRTRPQDAVDHAVGLTEIAALGDRAGGADRPLALVHARTEPAFEAAAVAVRAAFTLGEAAPAASDVVIERVGAGGHGP